MKVMRRAGLVAVLVMVASLLPGSIAHAQTVYEVEVGAELEGVPAASNRFFPSSLELHSDDTLHLTGFFPMAVLPQGLSAQEWREQSASDGNDPYTLFVPDSDDGPTDSKLNSNLLVASESDCGLTAEAACEYSGKRATPLDGEPGILFTGASFAQPVSFYVTITADPGEVLYIAAAGAKAADMRIEVVAADAPATTQEQIDAAQAEQVRRDTSTAQALHAKLSKPSKRVVNGKVVWDAFAGYDTRNISLIAMYPKKLTVGKGQKVRWHFDLENEYHSATFTADKALDVASQAFQPACDPDGDSGPGPDNPPELEQPPFCNDPSQFELDMGPKWLPEVGNNRITKNSELEHSGMRGPDDLQTGIDNEDYWDVRFDKTNKDGFKYFCLLHGRGMSGKVVVKR